MTTDARLLDFRQYWDEAAVLPNPDKGWYHHLIDNGSWSYFPKSDDELARVPGLDHLYIRLSWNTFEKERGKFDWSIIDKAVDRWAPIGYGFSLRFTARETGEEYATPKWVYDDGVPIEWHENWGKSTSSPDYGHPVFLRHLEAFTKAAAERYGRQPWLRYVDVGSYGEWGEGHRSFSGRKCAPMSLLQKHFQVALDAWEHVPVIASDDFFSEGCCDLGSGDNGQALLEWALGQPRLSLRDDSPLVGWYWQHNLDTDTVRSPEFFAAVPAGRPNVLELQHYHLMRSAEHDDTWRGRNGEERGFAQLEGALRRMRASYASWHGRIDDFLEQNPDVPSRLLNRIGYWLFPVSAAVPAQAARGSRLAFGLELENRGYAEPSAGWTAELTIGDAVLPVLGFASESIGPLASTRLELGASLPDSLPLGKSPASLRLLSRGEPVKLAMKGGLCSLDLGEIAIS